MRKIYLLGRLLQSVTRPQPCGCFLQAFSPIPTCPLAVVNDNDDGEISAPAKTTLGDMQNLNVPSLSDRATSISRKRQRSPSMNSATPSASPKRAVSEDTSNGAENNALTPSPLSSIEIDASMSDATEAPNITEPLAESASSGMSNEQKLNRITQLKNETIREGETWYLVSQRWYRKWEKAMTGLQDKYGGAEEADIGPVDNSPLLDTQGDLQTYLIEEEDVMYVPEEAWNFFVSWYVHLISSPDICCTYTQVW
jgi:hypothetical protein